MSELKNLNKKETCLLIEAFKEKTINAIDDVMLTKELKEVNRYLQFLEVYSQKIDIDLCNNIYALKSNINKDYAGAATLNDEAVKRITGWYNRFLIKIHDYIVQMPKIDQQDYVKILSEIAEKITSSESNLSGLINGRFDNLEKKIDNLPNYIQSSAQPAKENKENAPKMMQRVLEEPLSSSYSTNSKQQQRASLEEITIQGRKYRLEFLQYDALMQILNKTGTKKGEMQQFKEDEYNRYFGIEIGNKSITKLQINNYFSMKKIPVEIGQLSQLQILELRHNELSELPAEIGNLKSLKYLDLKCNDLWDLPAEIGNLKSLQNLNLFRNYFRELPAEIGNLKSLQNLDLNWNELDALPAEIGNLKSLQNLDLRCNDLGDLPSDIMNLTSLKNLYLEGTRLTFKNKIVKELKKKGVNIILSRFNCF